MSDFRDILGLGKHEPGAAPARKPKLSIQKPEGMSREVFALLNQDGIPGSAPLVPAPSPKDTFKEKIGRVIGWDWKQFSNTARSDSLKLSHWQKNNDRSTSYSFARFNKARARRLPRPPPRGHRPGRTLALLVPVAQPPPPRQVVKVLSYTEGEYVQWLQHPTWTRAETDTLFELCRRFDLRWPVIHDRMPGSRTVEALKDRFYAVCRMLLQGRLSALDGGSTSANELAEHPLARFSFDGGHETERKAEFERLYARSADEVAEEGRRLEQVRARVTPSVFMGYEEGWGGLRWGPLPATASRLRRIGPRSGRPERAGQGVRREMHRKAHAYCRRLRQRSRLSASRHNCARRDPFHSSPSPPHLAPALRAPQAKLLESKLRSQKKQLKPGGKAATIHALKATLAASGLGSGSDLALAGLPSLAGLMEPPKRPRSVGAWLRSADVSTKRPASDKQLSHFEQRLKDLGMPSHVFPTEANVRLYNTCRAHVVLLIELESKLKRLEYEKNVMLVKKAGGSAAAGVPAPKRSRSEQGERSVKRSHH
jgi:hypothetical protein